MSLLAVSQAGHSAPSDVFPFFALCAGAFVAFVALVSGAAALANRREDRLHGRSDAFSFADHEDHARSAGGPSARPWEDMYRRRGYDPAAELAAAEAASEARSARAASIHDPIGPSPSSAKQVADASGEASHDS